MLLTLLALGREHRVSRQVLLGALWPDSEESRGSHALSSMLHGLHETLGDALAGAPPVVHRSGGLELRPKSDGGWVLCVDPGVAIDGRGYPIELCAAVELDLSPEACACEPPPDKVCIAVRRITSDEAPHDACTCDLDEPRFDCRRVRDHVVVKAFTEPEIFALGDRVCRRTVDDKTPVCTALSACSACACGESWILLGCVTLDKDNGIVDPPDTSERRWVKPIAALCSGVLDRVNELEKTVEGLKPSVAPSPTGA
ncbi:AfsR/SARP family transcriptional regulator [Modestobacter marinus]|uniref:AfsR/SARP family transcriptional regulator n=1 Tax=Modestobacter marinus TaxID=477641 RepID=UPI001C965300|nr:hypothetical protein [Modestobacter marinus]